MSRLIVVPLGMLLTVSSLLCGCSSKDQAFRQSQSFPIEITDQLTAEETNSLQSESRTAQVKEHPIKFTAPLVTAADGHSKNGPYVQGQHARFVLDTSGLPPDCRNDASAPESAPCVREITIVSSKSNGSGQDTQAESAVLGEGSPRGVHAVEFDAIDASDIRVFVLLDGGEYVTFDATTGETINTGVMNSTATK